MRRFSGKLRHCLRAVFSFPSAVFLLAAASSLGSATSGPQDAPQAPQIPTLPGQNSGRPSFGQGTETEQDPAVRRAQEAAAKKRSIDRQNRLVADTNRILQLATELSADVDDNAEAPPYSTALRKADEIEKLARGVQVRMKSE